MISKEEHIPNGPDDQQDAMKQLMDQLAQNDSVVRVMMNDGRIMKAVEYDITKGYTSKLTNFSGEDMQARFNEFKKLVKRGSFTLAQLEDDVYARWGIDEKPRVEMADIMSNTSKSSPIGFSKSDTQGKKESGERI